MRFDEPNNVGNRNSWWNDGYHMYMIKWYIDLNHLDIGVEIIQMFNELFGVLFYTAHENLSPISRGPDDVIFRFVDCMIAFSESHETSLAQLSNRLDCPYLTMQSMVFQWAQ